MLTPYSGLGVQNMPTHAALHPECSHKKQGYGIVVGKQLTQVYNIHLQI